MSHISSHFARPHTSRSVGALPFTEDIEVRWVNRRVSNTRVAYAPPPLRQWCWCGRRCRAAALPHSLRCSEKSAPMFYYTNCIPPHNESI